MFFDNHSLDKKIENGRKLKQLRKDVVYYKEKIKNDREKLHELTSDKENIERYAREQYLMKKADEDIFVVIEK